MKYLPCWIVGAVMLCGCGTPAKKDEEPAAPVVSVEAVTVERRDMRHLQTVQGTFVAPQGGAAKLTAQVPGRILNVFVKEGDAVTAGQLLAQIDIRVQSAQQASAAAAAQAAKAQTTQSQLGYAATAADQAGNVRSAELALESARLDRDTQVLQAQNTFQSAQSDVTKTTTQSAQAVIQARVARDHAKSDYARSVNLSEAGFVSKRDLEAAKATLDTAQSALEAAQASQPADIRAARLRVASARLTLNAATSLGEKRIAQAAAALKQARGAEANVAAKRQEIVANQSLARQKQADVAAAAATASLGEIRAPFTGRVSRRALNPGDYADTTTSVLEVIGSGAPPDFLGSVTAEDAGAIHPGMLARLGEATGRVVNVSTADPLSGLCSVRIVGGFSAAIGSYSSGEIVLHKDPQAIAIPKEAVVDREGKTVVFRIDGDTAKMVEVTITAEDGGFDEANGLKPGDKLVKVGQFEMSDGAKIKLAEPEKADGEKSAPAKEKGD